MELKTSVSEEENQDSKQLVKKTLEKQLLKLENLKLKEQMMIFHSMSKPAKFLQKLLAKEKNLPTI